MALRPDRACLCTLEPRTGVLRQVSPRPHPASWRREECPQVSSRWQQGGASALREGQRWAPTPPLPGVCRGQRAGQPRPGGPSLPEAPQAAGQHPGPGQRDTRSEGASPSAPVICHRPVTHPQQAGSLQGGYRVVAPRATPETAATGDVTSVTLTGHWDRAIRKNASKCSSGGGDGKRVKSPPSTTPSHAQRPGGPGQHPKNSQGPRPCTGRPSQSPGNPRAPDPPSQPCDCNPCFQVKSPSSKNSHPSSVPTRQPGWAGRRARQALGTHPGGSYRNEAVARRDRLWEASPGLLTPPILRARGSGPSPKAQRGTQLASPCLPTSRARTTGPCTAWRAGLSQQEDQPGASGDGGTEDTCSSRVP